MGFTGHSGVEEPSAFVMFLEAGSRERLMAAEATCRAALERGEVLRGVRKTTIARTPMCAGGNLGLDNRRLLPPFVPVHRSEDAIFGLTLEMCDKDALMGFTPFAVKHMVTESRSAPLEDVLEGVGRFRAPDLLRLIVTSFGALRGRLPCHIGLRALGTQLESCGEMTNGDFSQWVTPIRRKALTTTALRLESEVALGGGIPASG
jgi:hypothetical protein